MPIVRALRTKQPAFLLLAASLFGSVAPRSSGQEADGRIPFLARAESDFLAGEISGDRSFEHVRWYTHWHRPFASEGLMDAARYTEARAIELGLQGVRLWKTPVDGMEWTARKGELWIVEPAEERLCDIGSVAISLADRSRDAEATAEIVDVGSGTKDEDYAGKDVAGRVVLAFGSASSVAKAAVDARGALGLVLRPDPETGWAHPDQVRWTALPERSGPAEKPTFAFVLSHRQGVDLAKRCAAGTVRVRVSVRVEIAPGWLVDVEGIIPGTDPSLPEVVFTGHLQEERFSANDDASGCANTLEVARALQRGIAEGRLPRPRRSLRFWWTTEIRSEDRRFADDPALPGRFLCNINQDMVGANQGLDTLRVQNVTRLPWSRAHLLDDVAEEVVDFLVKGNTSQLAGRQAGVSFFPFPVLSKLGTRHRYAARFVPYHANTDHQCFVAPPVGVPGITFTNWPDDYIHTSDDDLWNLDPTQLQRNALAVAAIGYAMARFGPDDEPMLAALVRSHASRRLGEETEVAARALRTAPASERPAALRDALAHVAASVARERWALRSVLQVTGAEVSTASARIAPTLDAHEQGVSTMLRVVADVAPAAPDASERALAAMRPRLVGSIAEYQARRPQAKAPAGLHGLVAHEILCLADANARHGLGLTGATLHHVAAAQVRSAGPWYYGTLSTEQTLAWLRACAEAGLVDLGEADPSADGSKGDGGR